jgi:protoporphyrinogen oxidase
MSSPSHIILGAGVTGLAAGVASGLPVFEAAQHPGGVCSSYYLPPNSSLRLPQPPPDGNAYRFEIGGGHWIFGGDDAVLHFIRSLGPARSYTRCSGVFFPHKNLYVPYPIQNHLRFMGADLAARALIEMARTPLPFTTMEQFLEQSFGPTLCAEFFFPFHELYTAGLYHRIAPQDPHKSPVDLSLAIRGAFADAPPVGYNATYLYPAEGLGTLARRMAQRAHVHCGKHVRSIDVSARTVYFADGSSVQYDRLLSTLPLNHMMTLTGLTPDAQTDPYTSVLVLNLGATSGARAVRDHWLYVPRSQSGFHRFGFYSNVDASFLPAGSTDRVSLYVERAYPGGAKPSDDQIAQYAHSAVKELQEWGFIAQPEVVDPTWIDVAYTWSWPGSHWRQKALHALEEHGIFQIGRYGRWTFQGIADSIRDGLFAGAAFASR